MKKYVFTVKDDVCIANGKDVNATRIREVMATYGTVEDYDASVAQIRAEYQASLDNAVAQNEAIKQQNLTEEEISLVNEYRKLRARAVQAYIDENARLTNQLVDIKTEYENRISLISEIIGKK